MGPRKWTVWNMCKNYLPSIGFIYCPLFLTFFFNFSLFLCFIVHIYIFFRFETWVFLCFLYYCNKITTCYFLLSSTWNKLITIIIIIIIIITVIIMIRIIITIKFPVRRTERFTMGQEKFWICHFFSISFGNELKLSNYCSFSPLGKTNVQLTHSALQYFEKSTFKKNKKTRNFKWSYLKDQNELSQN